MMASVLARRLLPTHLSTTATRCIPSNRFLPTANLNNLHHYQSKQYFSTEEDDEEEDTKPKRTYPTRNEIKQIQANIVTSKSLYKKQLSGLRKEYAIEYAKHKEKERKIQENLKSKLIANAHKRQVIKNIKSVANAKRDLAEKAQRIAEWEEELKVTQQKRDLHRSRMKKARELIISELEEEAPKWLISQEEINAQMDDDHAMEQLWTFDHAVIGAIPDEQPGVMEAKWNTGGDSTYWRYGSDTMDMSMTYLSPVQHYYNQLINSTVQDANIHNLKPEEVVVHKNVSERMRLRGRVRELALKMLVQRQIAEELGSDGNDDDGKEISANHPIREEKILKHHTQQLEEMERELILNPNNLHHFFEAGDDGESPMVKRHESYPMILGREPDDDSRSEKELRQLRKDIASGNKDEQLMNYDFKDEADMDGTMPIPEKPKWQLEMETDGTDTGGENAANNDQTTGSDRADLLSDEEVDELIKMMEKKSVSVQAQLDSLWESGKSTQQTDDDAAPQPIVQATGILADPENAQLLAVLQTLTKKQALFITTINFAEDVTEQNKHLYKEKLAEMDLDLSDEQTEALAQLEILGVDEE